MIRGAELQTLSGPEHGFVVMFNLERGYGFIRPNSAGDSSRDVFVHVRNVPGRRRLYPGQPVEYRVYRTEKGLAACEVIPGSLLGTPYLRYSLIGSLAALILLAIGAMLLRPQTRAEWLLIWVFAFSIASFGTYRYDKHQSQAGGTRVPEAVLHVLDGLGGTLGGFAGMHWPTHHKTSTPDFLRIYRYTCLAQFAVLGLFLLL